MYAESVQTGNLLFLTGMLPTAGGEAKFIGRVGAELDVDAARQAARLAALNALAVARQHLGSLDRVTRVVRLGVSIATSDSAVTYKGQPIRTARKGPDCPVPMTIASKSFFMIG